MSVWHMLNICLIYVKTKLKKPWQPTVVFGYKKIIMELFSLARGQSGIAVKTLGLAIIILAKNK